MKKVILLLLSLVMAIGLVACVEQVPESATVATTEAVVESATTAAADETEPEGATVPTEWWRK